VSNISWLEMVERTKIYNPSEEGIALSGRSSPVPIGLEAIFPRRVPIALTNLERLSTGEVLEEFKDKGLGLPQAGHLESMSDYEALVRQKRSPLIYLLPHYTKNSSNLRPAEIKAQTYSEISGETEMHTYTFDKEQEKISQMMKFGQVDNIELTREIARERDFETFLNHSWAKGANFLTYVEERS